MIDVDVGVAVRVKFTGGVDSVVVTVVSVYVCC